MARPEYCPNCGAPVPPGATACPECGSDEETGWAEDAYAAKLGISEEEFDYDEFNRKEFGSRKEVKPRGITWVWWVVAAILLLLLAAGWLL